MNDDALLTTEQVASRWSLSPAYLANLRSRHRGPVYVRIGPRGSVRYRYRDVIAYEQTVEPAAA